MTPNTKQLLPSCAQCVIRNGLFEAGVDATEANLHCRSLWMNRARKRHVLFMEGNRATHFYAVRKGQVKLLKSDASGREHIVAQLQPGDVFGLEALFDDTYGCTAEALSDAEVCVGAREEIEAMDSTGRGFSFALARYLHRQLELSRARQTCLGLVGARARVAAYLLHEAREEEGVMMVPHHLTHAELGAVLGVTGETVCRVMSTLKQKDLVEVDGGQITLKDADGLRNMTRG